MKHANARLGLALFAVYAACYLAFVLVNALRAEWMDAIGPFGLNVAVLSGFALIVLALVLALVYGATAGDAPHADDPPGAA